MKKTCILLLTILLVFSLALPAFAASNDSKIIDDANLLTEAERLDLEGYAQRLTKRFDIDVRILTVDSFSGSNITKFADDYYDNHGFGVGSDHSGVMLVLSMEDRDWAITTTGKAIKALTDYGQDQLMDLILPDLEKDAYYEAFLTFVLKLDDYFVAYEEGNPIDNTISILAIVLISLGVGLVIAIIAICIMRIGMKTIRPQRGAASYVKSGSYQLHRQKDLYLYSRTTRTRRAESSSGSSTHRSSSGRSHGGSRGKF